VIAVFGPVYATVHAQLHFGLHVPRGVGAYLPGTVLAALGAVLFAVGSVLQHDAAGAATGAGGLRARELVRRPAWLAGQLSTVSGSGLQVAALALAPVSIVQPLLGAGLIVALGVRSLRSRCLPSNRELLGAALTAGGLAVFLVAARPAPGAAERLPHPAAVVAAAVLGLVLVGAATRLPRGALGAVACGVAAGVVAGIAAVLVSSALKVLSQHGLLAVPASPELWAAIVLAVAAQIGAQQAFSRGALTWSLPALTVSDPLAAVPAAWVLLGERLAPGHATVWAPAAVVAAVGIVFLARSEDTCHRPLTAGRTRRRNAPTDRRDAEARQ
jgi:hypothetical protein